MPAKGKGKSKSKSKGKGKTKKGKGKGKDKNKNKSTSEPPPKVRQGDCPYWVKFGKCRDGQACAFVHDESRKGSRRRSQSRKKHHSPKPKGGNPNKSDTVPPPPKATGPSRIRHPSPAGGKTSEVCKKFLQGKCQDTGCKRGHPRLCHHFESGDCSRGENCAFIHPGHPYKYVQAAAAKQISVPKKHTGTPPPKKQGGKADPAAKSKAKGKAKAVQAVAVALVGAANLATGEGASILVPPTEPNLLIIILLCQIQFMHAEALIAEATLSSIGFRAT